MDVKTKLNLLKLYESYWQMIPYEIQEYILVFKINQEVVEEKRKQQNVMLCREIMVHFQLKEKWGLGPIRCKTYKCKSCVGKGGRNIHTNLASHIRIDGFYYDIENVKRSVLLGYGFTQAFSRLHHVKSLL